MRWLTLLTSFAVKDRGIAAIAEIVREADLHDGVDLAINSLVEVTPADHELLDRGMAIFEGLYPVLKQKA